MFDQNGVCVPITDCSIPRCVWGDCVLVSDPDNPGELIWSCNCYSGWTGVHCNETDPVYLSALTTVSTGWMSSVSAALLLLLSECSTTPIHEGQQSMFKSTVPPF